MSDKQILESGQLSGGLSAQAGSVGAGCKEQLCCREPGAQCLGLCVHSVWSPPRLKVQKTELVQASRAWQVLEDGRALATCPKHKCISRTRH